MTAISKQLGLCTLCSVYQAAGAPKVAAVVVPKPVVVKVVAAEVVKPEAAGGLTEAERKQQRAER